MHFSEHHYHNIIKYDFVNKFNYKNSHFVPKLTKIVLNLGIKEINFKLLLALLTSLELISSQKATLTRSSISNISLKIRKGAPVGCKVTLRRAAMHSFFAKLVVTILSNTKQFSGFSLSSQINQSGAFSFNISDILDFSEIESQYELFKSTPRLDISITTSCRDKNELKNLFASFRFPIK